MSKLLLAEDLFLLTHDNESGKSSTTVGLDNGMAGALLLDLASAGLLVTTDNKRIMAVDGAASHQLLVAAHRQIASSGKHHGPQHWVSRLPRDLSLAESVGRSLVERGILREERSKTWGLFPVTVWPAVDTAPETALRATLRAVLVDGRGPDPHTAQLVALASALDLVTQIVGNSDRKAANARANKITEDAASSAAVTGAVSATVQAVQVAILTAVVVPGVIVATTS